MILQLFLQWTISYLVKYADDIMISVPVRQSIDTAAAEVENMKKWADINEMSLNFTKTWKMCIHGKLILSYPLQNYQE